jgi:aquaporin related protein
LQAFRARCLTLLSVFESHQSGHHPPTNTRGHHTQVTLGLLLSGALTISQAILYIAVQLVAGISAAALVDALTPGPLLVSNALAADISPARGLWIEAILTAQLVLTVLIVIRGPYPPVFSAVGVSLSVFMGHITSVNFTGTGINPARSLGPNVVMADFPSTAWVYYVGPVMGAFIAVAVFGLLGFLGSSVSERDPEVKMVAKH